ncbi:MAG: peptidoglycan recognition family protein [Planctomycetota bacterium]|jgi:hypothetical protein|nr:peptidoglycan recognition family protein [Planctomycetota bacterium]MDP6954333.1 peptidoglycan recognition family protein [Planctomycetota bacterium]
MLCPFARQLFLIIGPALLLAGCAATPGALPPEPPEPAPSAIPTWVGQENSWEKLDAIEDWLSYAPGTSFWAVEGRLLLAEGWLGFSRDDGNRQRLLRAHTNFARVADASGRSASQAARAAAGQRACSAALAGLSGQGNAAGLGHLGIKSRRQWGATRSVAARLTPARAAYSRITVHHAGEGPGTDLAAGVSQALAADALRRIQAFHIKERGWGDVGYHFLIDPAGRTYEGRPLAYQGAHAGGNNNVGNIGICLLGNFNLRRPTPAACAALRRLLDGLREQHSIQKSRIYPHDRFKTTDCPGQRLKDWLRSY